MDMTPWPNWRPLSDSPRARIRDGNWKQIRDQTFATSETDLGGGNSNIFYFHPYLRKIPILTNIFQRG